MTRLWFRIPSFGIAVALGSCLSACAGGASNPSPILQTSQQQARHSSPHERVPIYPITVTESFSPKSFNGQAGGTSHLTITFASNPDDILTLSSLAFTDTLPANLYVAAGQSAAQSNSCGGTTGVGSNLATFWIKGGTLGTNGASCSITFLISGHTAGTFENVIPAGAVTAEGASTSTAATAEVTVLPPHVIP